MNKLKRKSFKKRLIVKKKSQKKQKGGELSPLQLESIRTKINRLTNRSDEYNLGFGNNPTDFDNTQKVIYSFLKKDLDECSWEEIMGLLHYALQLTHPSHNANNNKNTGLSNLKLMKHLAIEQILNYYSMYNYNKQQIDKIFDYQTESTNLNTNSANSSENASETNSQNSAASFDFDAFFDALGICKNRTN